MATVIGYTSLDLENASAWYGSVYQATGSSIVIGDGYRTAYYTGYGFQYNSTTVKSGTLTGYSSSSGGITEVRIFDFAYAAADAANLINSNQLTVLYERVLAGADAISGSSYSDRLYGYSGNDFIQGAAGNDIINGGDGTDTAIYANSRADYSIGAVSTWTQIAAQNGTDGTDALVNVERLKFTDGCVAIDIDGNAGEAYRLYKAALDRVPDETGLGDWIYALDTGLLDLGGVASGFINSAEFKGKYGNAPTNDEFITLLYQNVLDRLPDAQGFADWQRAFDLGQTRESVLIGFSESPENQANVIALIANGIQYQEHMV